MTQEGVPASGRAKSASGQPGSLICQLDKLITLAENRGGKAGRWASIWLADGAYAYRRGVVPRGERWQSLGLSE